MKNDRVTPRTLALAALAGSAASPPPAALFTWGFDYTWRVAALEPWQLAGGGSDTWHRAHLALIERHRPHIIFYEGAGHGPADATLLEEDARRWVYRDGNTARRMAMDKISLAVHDADAPPSPPARIECPADIDRAVAPFDGWSATYLEGLRRLITEAADAALVLPHHSPAYICACYCVGFERAMEMLLAEPDLFQRLIDRFREGETLRMKQWRSAGVEACFIADGWASCDIISRDMFERFALPCQRSIAAAAHEAGLKIILWNEGNIHSILDLEASLDIDAFAFEQSRKGVTISLSDVRRALGEGRCLMGNLDSEGLLLRADPAEIAAAVRSQAAQCGRGSPFIFSTGSPIPSNVSPEAVEAFLSAAGSVSN